MQAVALAQGKLDMEPWVPTRPTPQAWSTAVFVSGESGKPWLRPAPPALRLQPR